MAHVKRLFTDFSDNSAFHSYYWLLDLKKAVELLFECVELEIISRPNSGRNRLNRLRPCETKIIESP